MPVAPYKNAGVTPDSSSGYFLSVTPSDTVLLPCLSKSIAAFTSGTIAVLSEHGDVVTLPAGPAGYEYPVHVQRVLNTGTTAQGIVAYF